LPVIDNAVFEAIPTVGLCSTLIMELALNGKTTRILPRRVANIYQALAADDTYQRPGCPAPPLSLPKRIPRDALDIIKEPDMPWSTKCVTLTPTPAKMKTTRLLS